MRACKFILIILFFLSIPKVWSQSDLLQTKITILITNTTQKDFIKTLEKELGLHFSYSDNIFSDTLLPRIEYRQVPLNAILGRRVSENILSDTLLPRIEYRQVPLNAILKDVLRGT